MATARKAPRRVTRLSRLRRSFVQTDPTRRISYFSGSESYKNKSSCRTRAVTRLADPAQDLLTVTRRRRRSASLTRIGEESLTFNQELILEGNCAQAFAESAARLAASCSHLSRSRHGISFKYLISHSSNNEGTSERVSECEGRPQISDYYPA